jgi:hypothetical protein
VVYLTICTQLAFSRAILAFLDIKRQLQRASAAVGSGRYPLHGMPATSQTNPRSETREGRKKIDAAQERVGIT